MKEIRRLYANLQDGTKIGYLDLGTLERVPESIDTAGLLANALEAALSEGAAVPQTGAAAISGQRTSRPPMPWHDLAGNRPGQQIENLEAPGYRAGVAGEQRTAGVLAALGDVGYRMLHSIPISPRKDLDHLVIGPAGVFAVNTKSTTYEVSVRQGGAVYSDGYRQNWIESIERDAGIVGERLSAAGRMDVSCTPLVAVWSALAVHGSGTLFSGDGLPEAITSLPAPYPPAWVDVVYNVARRSDTWTLQGTGRH